MYMDLTSKSAIRCAATTSYEHDEGASSSCPFYWRFLNRRRTRRSWRHQRRESLTGAASDCPWRWRLLSRRRTWRSGRHRRRESLTGASSYRFYTQTFCRKLRTRIWRQDALVCCCCCSEHAPCRSERWSLIGRWRSCGRSDTGYPVAMPVQTQKQTLITQRDEKSDSGCSTHTCTRGWSGTIMTGSLYTPDHHCNANLLPACATAL